MIIKNGRIKLFSFAVLAAVIVALTGCAGPQARVAQNELDTPEHHVFTGMKLIDQEKYADAQREFELALQLNDKYSKAYVGLGLACAYQQNYTEGLLNMDTAWKRAEKNDEKEAVHIGYIRVNTLSKTACMKIGVDCEQDQSWLEKSRDSFNAAIELNPSSAAAHYYMGLAYKTALQFGNAGIMFSRVLKIKGDYVRQADEQWNLVQKIQRAMPGTTTGKKIALVEKISRADAAALFMEELKIDDLYKNRTAKTFDTSFKDPEKAAATAVKGQISARDIADHPLRADIEGILNIGVRGLEVGPNGNFDPDALLNRAEYAMMLEDILIKVTGDNALATKYIGSQSLFPDLREDLPYFNAVMVLASRTIMGGELTSGEFAPLKPVAGVDALLIIRQFNENLKN